MSDLTEDVRFPEDCKRIRRAVELRTAHNIVLTLQECEEAWASYSNSMCAGWLFLPPTDDVLYHCIEAHIPRCPHCGAQRRTP